MGVWRGGKREIIYLSLHCHHQNNSCIKMGSDESHFNVSLIVRGKVTRQRTQTTTFFEEKGEPKRIRTEVLPLTILLVEFIYLVLACKVRVAVSDSITSLCYVPVTSFEHHLPCLLILHQRFRSHSASGRLLHKN